MRDLGGWEGLKWPEPILEFLDYHRVVTITDKVPTYF